MGNIADLCLQQGVKLLNLGGNALRTAGMELPSLDRQALEKAARRRSGLDDPGPWDIDEPVGRLLEAYRCEANLTTLGRITVRELLVSSLEGLMQLEADRRRHPEIDAQRIDAPVFITGLPRTGTTLLHGLMSEDPQTRVPRTWEVMYPAGFSRTDEDIDRVRARTQSRMGWANRLAPEFKRIHPIAADLPQECIAITALVLRSIQFHTTHNVPSYQDWFEAHGHGQGYRFHRHFLQHLQARGGPGRWVLKAPGHLFGLDALLAEYPDARIIQTHRDPLRVMASMASHANVLRRAFSDTVNPGAIAADWAERWSVALESFLAVRDTRPASLFLDLDYGEIESQPLGAIEKIYDFLGWSLSPQARAAMSAYLEANPKNKHGVHRYSLDRFGLDRDSQFERFRPYCERFDIAVQAE